MYNDTVSDLLTRIRNAAMAGKMTLTVRSSSLVERIVDVLKSEGFVASVAKEGRELTLELATGQAVDHIKRLSKPSLRRYVSYKSIPRPQSGFGLIIVSTPKGVMTGNQARKQKVGGELICEVW